MNDWNPIKPGQKHTGTAGQIFAVGLLALAAVNACGAAGDGEDVDVWQEQLTLDTQSAIDTYIRQASATSNFGTATSCHADGDDGSGTDKSCLIRWDVSGIPSGATVTSASVTLRVTEGSSNTYGVFALNRAWNESEATWNRATTSTNWQTAGALGANDRGAQIGSVTGNTNTTQTVTLNAAGIATVQSWVNGGTNAGIVIAHASNSNGIDFASSEHGTLAYRPKLTVNYTTSGGTGGSGGSSGSGGSEAGETAPNLLIAFIGDQGNGSNADAVLNLIKNEGAAATVHNGDFDYGSNPSAWDNRVNDILGANYPYFAVVGNHDGPAWNGTTGYQSKINARLARVPEMNCVGDPGVKSKCVFRGLVLLQSCVGTTEVSGHGNCAANSTEQVSFLTNELAADNHLWSICSWHKNQNDMQVGTKSNEVGWNAYAACQNGGAVISTGHEHSYSRTLTLDNLGNAADGHGALGLFDQLQVQPGAPGRTFVFVSGLGGNSVRPFDAGGHNDDTWWATYYTSDRWVKNDVLQSGTGAYGALFVRFNVGGNPKRADGYFKDVNGRIVDTFTATVP